MGRPEGAVAAAAEPGTGALKMLCCRSVISAAAAGLGMWKVPSSFAMMLDLDFA